MNTILNPINHFFKAHNKLVRAKECDLSFKKLKTEITSDHLLAHFDPEQTLELATDASPIGLWVVLSHCYKDVSEIPISLTLRSPTVSEKMRPNRLRIIGYLLGIKKISSILLWKEIHRCYWPQPIGFNIWSAKNLALLWLI